MKAKKTVLRVASAVLGTALAFTSMPFNCVTPEVYAQSIVKPAVGAVVSGALTDNQIVKFDFGTKTSGIATGFLDGGVTYSEETGYGLTAVSAEYLPAKATVNASSLSNETDADLKNACYDFGCVQATGSASMEFTVDLPQGTYDVKVYAGGVDNNDTFKKNTFTINGSEAYAAKNGVRATAEEMETKQRVTVGEDGKLVINVENINDGKTVRAFLNAVIIEKVVTYPEVLSFDFGARLGVADGFANGDVLYTDDLGYGLSSVSNYKTDKGSKATFDSESNAALKTAVSDFGYENSATDSMEFSVNLKAGTYVVNVYAGGTDSNTTYNPNKITIDGTEMAGSAQNGAQASASAICFTKEVELEKNSQIKISANNSGGRAYMNAIVISEKDEGPIAAPTNLTATSTATSVTLNWNESAAVDHFNIFRADSAEGAFLQVGTTTATTFTDSVITAKEFCYYVVAVGKDSEGNVLVSNSSKVAKAPVASAGNEGAASVENYSNRALVAASTTAGVFVSWRSYSNDTDTTYTVSRNGQVVYTGTKTNFTDANGKAGDTYTLVAGANQSTEGESVVAWNGNYQTFTLVKPADQVMPNGEVATYESNDMSVGDLDGDGQLELIVKWYPSNAQDNSLDGYTGTTFLDAYKLDYNTGAASLMWRIDLGLNIRSGAHYTQFQVWDYNGDGKAEVVCKTADGTTTYDSSLNETGFVGAVSMASLNMSATEQAYDYRMHSGRLGRIVNGPEYITAFDGATGTIIDTENYAPARGVYDETTGIYNTADWGLKNGANAESNDGYANRADRFLAGTAHLDNGSDSVIMTRGYYGRTAITAYKLVGGKLEVQWTFFADTKDADAGQGNHNLSINDVDGDGFDEIIFGALVVDHDGKTLVNTNMGHGDALHVSDWNGDGKLEVYKVCEDEKAAYLYNPLTGEKIWNEPSTGDVGRGVAADVDPRYNGAEMWHSIDSHTHSFDGTIIYPETKPSQNFSIFWDGDLLMELFDSNDAVNLVGQVQKWNYANEETEVLLELVGTKLNNGTKGNAGLVGDILGDWREEIIVREDADQSKIRLYTTTYETDYTVTTMLEDRAYREGLAWQNTAYNQPANLSYLLTTGLKTAVVTVGERTTNSVELSWTEASDGVYGHEVEAYEVYRAEGTDDVAGEYSLVATTTELNVTDTGLKSNSQYFYKVCAVVDGKTSYESFAVSTKTTVDAAGLKDIEGISVVQDSTEETFKAAFPTTLVLVDQAGNENIVDVTWNFDEFDITSVSEQTINGNIYGYDGDVKIVVTVTPNSVASNEDVDAVYTKVGVEPSLVSSVNLTFKNGVSEDVAVVWNTAEYNLSQIGDYTVNGTCITKYGEVYAVTMTVGVRDEYIVSVNDGAYLEVTYGTTGADMKLPSTVNTTWTDGTTKDCDVVWDELDTTKIGMTTLLGHVTNYPVAVKLNVSVNYEIVNKFDFGLTSSPVTEGWTGVSVDKNKTAAELGIAYTAEQGWGFVESDVKFDGRLQKTNYAGIPGLYPESVYQDLVLASTSAAGYTFKVDVPNGEYVVEMMSGSTDKSTVKVTINGEAYAVSNVACTYEVGAFPVTVTNGTIEMNFTAGNYSRLDAVIVRKVPVKAEEPEVDNKTENDDKPVVVPVAPVAPSVNAPAAHTHVEGNVWLYDHALSREGNSLRHKECEVCGEAMSYEVVPASAVPNSDSYTAQVEADRTTSSSKATEVEADANIIAASKYVVVAGDNMYAIARKHGISFAELVAMNPQVANPSLIMPGLELNVSGKASSAISTPAATPAEVVDYVVKAGEFLFKIARENGMTYDELIKINPQVTNPSLIFPGQILKIKK